MERLITLYESPDSPCPYLPDRIWKTHIFSADVFPEPVYERLLDQGFRRSGMHFYRNRCPGCTACRQLRVPVKRFRPTRSQRKTSSKNRDVTVVTKSPAFRRDVYELYRRYVEYKHGKTDTDEENFRNFLCLSPIDTRIMMYYAGPRLAGVGWVDFLPRSLSSVYFAFDPDFASRSLGTFSVLEEIELCMRTGREWHYLGFQVEGSAKMEYKDRFRPHEKLIDGRFVAFD